MLDCITENHHVKPTCIGGDNSFNNLVRLTCREHFIAHVLLVKIYPNEPKLIFAVKAMCMSNQYQNRSKNRMYGWLREECTLAQTGRKHTEESKAKMRGRKVSTASRAKMSRAKLKMSAETKAKMSSVAKGRKVSTETKAKISASMKARHAKRKF